MLTKPSSLTIRPVTAADRLAVLALCATVWDDDEYIPAAFDMWVAEESGNFVLGEREGEVVVLAKLTRLAWGEYWIQGIRVHAAHQRQGLATAICAQLIDRWRSFEETGALRLITDTEAVAKICRANGFEPLFNFTFAQAEAVRQAHRFTPLTLIDEPRAWDVIQRAPYTQQWRGLCDVSWRWRSLTRDFLKARIAKGAAFKWGEWEGVLLTVHYLADDPAQRALGVQFPGVLQWQQLASFLSDARGLAHAQGLPYIRWTPDPALVEPLTPLGYRRLWDVTQTCFELRATFPARLSDTDHAAAPGVDWAHTIFWTKQVRQWPAVRRATVQTALRATLAQPDFSANAYQRRYTVAGLDDSAHAGASLLALEKVLAAFESI